MYTIEKLTQVSDCDAILAWVKNEKENLELKKLNEVKLTKNYLSTSLSIDTELQSVNSQIATLNALIPTLPIGSIKEENLKKLKKLEYKKFLLEDRKINYGAVALLQKELDVERLTKELEEINAFILLVTQKRTSLSQ
ncbi:hypothetical protein [Flavobacterium oreochromis]|uniref:Uncharacterized protein n=2 Tax=Flavobacterium TaxID=237 RepID=A0A246G881_9FLAO|nr:hypothetical protein [Flavobacterium oreochromis]OWP75010.1 hypothetical protein BWK62_12945 [Flavobacterium oreochromis]OWP76476.1 hypothetical protein BWG23_07705 [Flavobacterium oreochromis]POR23590.1 hypothetical protein BWK58_09910 [Flavobacterium columnare]QYS86920.1 hypothetical protein JJC03_02625 [Flavobacterium oreochromis]